jgi:glycosyltransferase involved in cell wall biosynthesis
MDYIRSSLGEFTVSKEQYVHSCSGWFSDRSVCYLASGRPVITQETGFSNIVPTGEGLFAYATEEEALASIEHVAADYPRQSRAAYEIAREFFSAEKVLGDVMRQSSLM